MWKGAIGVYDLGHGHVLCEDAMGRGRSEARVKVVDGEEVRDLERQGCGPYPVKTELAGSHCGLLKKNSFSWSKERDLKVMERRTGEEGGAGGHHREGIFNPACRIDGLHKALQGEEVRELFPYLTAYEMWRLRRSHLDFEGTRGREEKLGVTSPS